MKQKALSSLCMHFCINKDVDGILNGVPAYVYNLSKNDQYSQLFSKTRDAGKEIAIFHCGQNAALKNLS